MMFVIMIGSAIVFTSCGGDDDEYIGGSEDANVITKLATEAPQSVTIDIQDRSNFHVTIQSKPVNVDQVIFHSDFRYRYAITLYGGALAIIPYALNSDGQFSVVGAYENGCTTILREAQGLFESIYDYTGAVWYSDLHDVGNRIDIGGFRTRDEYGRWLSAKILTTDLIPKHFYFLKCNGNDGQTIFRIYIEDVIVGSKGEVKGAKIQYLREEQK